MRPRMRLTVILAVLISARSDAGPVWSGHDGTPPSAAPQIAGQTATAETAQTQLAEPEDFLLPRGFVGEVFVLFDVPDGAPTWYVGGRRMYEIPADGFLRTQLGNNTGALDQRYFYPAKDSGRLEPLAIGGPLPREDRDADSTPRVYALGSGSLTRGATGCRIQFASYFVGTGADALAYRRKAPSDVDALSEYLESHPVECAP